MITHLNRRLLTLGAVTSCMIASAFAAAAEGYPAETIQIVVPYSTGGGTDLTARYVADQLQQRKGWTVIIENKPGGASQIGVNFVTRAEPDGYTILWAPPTSLSLLTATQPDVAFKMPDDFTFITSFGSFPLCMGVRNDLPVTSMGEFMDYAKAHPGELNYSTAGSGGPDHLMMGSIFHDKGLDLIQIPYDGSGPAAIAVAGGHADVASVAPSTIAPYAADGIRVVACSGSERTPLFPDVPTFGEAGYGDYTFDNFYAVYGPAGTPKEVTDALRDAISEIQKDPETVAWLAKNGLGTYEISDDNLRDYVLKDTARWTKVVKDINFSPNN